MVVAFWKILVVCRVNRPEVAFAIVASTCFDEAIIEGQVVPHAVSPVFILLEYVEWKKMWLEQKLLESKQE